MSLIKTQLQTMYVSDQVRHFSLFIYLCVILDTIRVISNSEGVRTVNVPTPSLSSSPTLPYDTLQREIAELVPGGLVCPTRCAQLRDDYLLCEITLTLYLQQCNAVHLI